MRNFYFTIVLFSIIIIAANCSKPAGGFNFTFTNQTDRLVQINIYRTKVDYEEGPYPIVTGSIYPQGNFSVPSSVLIGGQDFYVDWYSDNFDYSNWGDSTAVIKFTPTATNNSFYITAASKNNFRKLCLSGDQHQSIWLAADIFDDSNTTASIWQQIPDSERYCQVILTRRFNGSLDVAAANKKSIHELFSNFTLSQNGSGITVRLNDTMKHVFFSPFAGSAATPSNIDSAWIDLNGRKYLMIKQ